MNARPLPPHGTNARYGSAADPCRCAACRSAHAEAVRSWRKRSATWAAVEWVRRAEPVPTRFRCPGCGGQSAEAAGHPACNQRGVA